MMKIQEKGIVLQIQDYSINDGAGVRTTIFLPGCPLRCKWCANPETWTLEKKLVYYKHKCTSCGRCKNVCLNGLDPANMKRPNEVCNTCGRCVQACLNRSLDIVCTSKTVQEVVDSVRREEIFFRYTGGGITFSGGEPFVQSEFLRLLVDRFSKIGISMWVETCGYFEFDKVKDIIAELSHVFLDIKHMNTNKHKEYTGVGNEKILENAKKINEMGIPITVRIPSIPGINLTEENIRQTAQFMKKNMKGSTIELLPYHELGKAKYTSLGIENKYNEFTTPTDEELKFAYDIFKKYEIVVEEYK